MEVFPQKILLKFSNFFPTFQQVLLNLYSISLKLLLVCFQFFFKYFIKILYKGWTKTTGTRLCIGVQHTLFNNTQCKNKV